MSLLEIILIGLGLSMDCFAVSLSFSTCGKLKWKEILKMSLFFGVFQGGMPVLGWFFGESFRSHIQAIDHWLAFGVLSSIGLRMVIQFFRKEEKRKTTDIRKTHVLLSLSIATSIDALVTGISLGFIRVNILLAACIFTLVTFVVSLTGGRLGQRSSFIPARWAELAGGLVLIAIGTRILISHLSA